VASRRADGGSIPSRFVVFTAGLDAVGARNPRVTGKQVSLLEATYEVGWDA